MNEKQFSEYWQYLVRKKYDPKAIELTKNEFIFYSVNSLRGAVPRSGFIGYFENTNTDSITQAKEGLELLNLKDALKIFEKVQDIILGEKKLPNNNQPLDIFSDLLTEEEYEAASEILDKAIDPFQKIFYGYDEQIFNSLCVFADKNKLNTNG